MNYELMMNGNFICQKALTNNKQMFIMTIS